MLALRMPSSKPVFVFLRAMSPVRRAWRLRRRKKSRPRKTVMMTATAAASTMPGTAEGSEKGVDGRVGERVGAVRFASQASSEGKPPLDGMQTGDLVQVKSMPSHRWTGAALHMHAIAGGWANSVPVMFTAGPSKLSAHLKVMLEPLSR